MSDLNLSFVTTILSLSQLGLGYLFIQHINEAQSVTLTNLESQYT